MQALLNAAQPEDVGRLVRVYRSLPSSRTGDRQLGAFASAVGAGRLVQEAGHASKNGLDAILQRITWWLGSEPELSDECANGLAQAFRSRHRGTFTILLR